MLVIGLAAGTAGAAPPPLDLGKGVQLALVEVPAGSFTQGSADGEPGHAPDEGKREVRISQAFWIGRSPVTVGQFRRFAEDAGYVTEAEKGTSGGYGWDGSKLSQRKEFTWRSPGYVQSDDHPAVIVTFGDAQAFTAWASRKSGLAVRLPSEAEWEKAAHGNTTSRFFWGNDETQAEQRGWFAKNAGRGAMPVGSKGANELGLQDAAGNVWQWCLDFHGPITSAAATDPFASSAVTWEHSDKPRRVLKGGSWLTNDRWKLRVAARNRATEGSRNADFGFRVVVLPAGTRDPLGAAAGGLAAGSPGGTTPGNGKPGGGSSSSDAGAAAAGAGLAFGCGAFGCTGAIIVGAIFLVMRSVLRGQRARQGGGNGGPGGMAPPAVQVRVATDGFWLVAPGASARADVTYVLRTQRGTTSGRAVVDPGPRGTFVYTGEPPIDVRLTAVNVAGAAGGAAAGRGRSRGWSGGSSHHETRRHEESSSWGSSHGTGWPSAY